MTTTTTTTRTTTTTTTRNDSCNDLRLYREMRERKEVGERKGLEKAWSREKGLEKAWSRFIVLNDEQLREGIVKQEDRFAEGVLMR